MLVTNLFYEVEPACNFLQCNVGWIKLLDSNIDIPCYAGSSDTLHKFSHRLHTCLWLSPACPFISFSQISSSIRPLTIPEKIMRYRFMQVISDVMHCCTGQSEESFLPRSGSTFSPGVQRHGEGNAARTYFFNGKASYRPGRAM